MDEFDAETDGFGGAGGGGADDGDPAGDGGDAVELGATMEGVDGVGAGEDEPIVGADGGTRGVERAEGLGRGEFDGGDQDRDCAEGFELTSQLRGLMAGARN